jgi:hypothetical protein
VIDVDRPPTLTRSESLLAIWGLLPRLRAACDILAQTPESVTRCATLSMPIAPDLPANMTQAVHRFAEEHCLEAEVVVRNDRLDVRLRRSS